MSEHSSNKRRRSATETPGPAQEQNAAQPQQVSTTQASQATQVIGNQGQQPASPDKALWYQMRWPAGCTGQHIATQRTIGILSPKTTYYPLFNAVNTVHYHVHVPIDLLMRDVRENLPWRNGVVLGLRRKGAAGKEFMIPPERDNMLFFNLVGYFRSWADIPVDQPPEIVVAPLACFDGRRIP